MNGPMPSPPQTPMRMMLGFLVVEPVRCVLQALDAGELLLDQGADVVSGAVENRLVYHDVQPFCFEDGGGPMPR